MANSVNNLLQPFIDDHQQALQKIAVLNAEIRQKDQLIHSHMEEMLSMKGKMDECLKSLNHILTQLLEAEANFKNSQHLLLQKISEKDQTIVELEQANDAWAQRTIKLEFELLAARNALN